MNPENPLNTDIIECSSITYKHFDGVLRNRNILKKIPTIFLISVQFGCD